MKVNNNSSSIKHETELNGNERKIAKQPSIKRTSKLIAAQSVVRRSIRHLAKICGSTKKYHQNCGQSQEIIVNVNKTLSKKAPQTPGPMATPRPASQTRVPSTPKTLPVKCDVNANRRRSVSAVQRSFTPSARLANDPKTPTRPHNLNRPMPKTVNIMNVKTPQTKQAVRVHDRQEVLAGKTPSKPHVTVQTPHSIRKLQAEPKTPLHSSQATHMKKKLFMSEVKKPMASSQYTPRAVARGATHTVVRRRSLSLMTQNMRQPAYPRSASVVKTQVESRIPRFNKTQQAAATTKKETDEVRDPNATMLQLDRILNEHPTNRDEVMIQLPLNSLVKLMTNTPKRQSIIVLKGQQTPATGHVSRIQTPVHGCKLAEPPLATPQLPMSTAHTPIIDVMVQEAKTPTVVSHSGQTPVAPNRVLTPLGNRSQTPVASNQARVETPVVAAAETRGMTPHKTPTIAVTKTPSLMQFEMDEMAAHLVSQTPVQAADRSYEPTAMEIDSQTPLKTTTDGKDGDHDDDQRHHIGQHLKTPLTGFLRAQTPRRSVRLSHKPETPGTQAVVEGSEQRPPKTPFYQIHFQSPRLSARVSSLDGIQLKNAPLIFVEGEDGHLINFSLKDVQEENSNDVAATTDPVQEPFDMDDELEQQNQIEILSESQIKISKQPQTSTRNPFKRLTRSTAHLIRKDNRSSSSTTTMTTYDEIISPFSMKNMFRSHKKQQLQHQKNESDHPTGDAFNASPYSIRRMFHIKKHKPQGGGGDDTELHATPFSMRNLYKPDGRSTQSASNLNTSQYSMLNLFKEKSTNVTAAHSDVNITPTAMKNLYKNRESSSKAPELKASPFSMSNLFKLRNKKQNAENLSPNVLPAMFEQHKQQQQQLNKTAQSETTTTTPMARRVLTSNFEKYSTPLLQKYRQQSEQEQQQQVLLEASTIGDEEYSLREIDMMNRIMELSTQCSKLEKLSESLSHQQQQTEQDVDVSTGEREYFVYPVTVVSGYERICSEIQNNENVASNVENGGERAETMDEKAAVVASEEEQENEQKAVNQDTFEITRLAAVVEQQPIGDGGDEVAEEREPLEQSQSDVVEPKGSTEVDEVEPLAENTVAVRCGVESVSQEEPIAQSTELETNGNVETAVVSQEVVEEEEEQQQPIGQSTELDTVSQSQNVVITQELRAPMAQSTQESSEAVEPLSQDYVEVEMQEHGQQTESVDDKPVENGESVSEQLPVTEPVVPVIEVQPEPQSINESVSDEPVVETAAVVTEPIVNESIGESVEAEASVAADDEAQNGSVVVVEPPEDADQPIVEAESVSVAVEEVDAQERPEEVQVTEPIVEEPIVEDVVEHNASVVVVAEEVESVQQTTEPQAVVADEEVSDQNVPVMVQDQIEATEEVLDANETPEQETGANVQMVANESIHVEPIGGDDEKRGPTADNPQNGDDDDDDDDMPISQETEEKVEAEEQQQTSQESTVDVVDGGKSARGGRGKKAPAKRNLREKSVEVEHTEEVKTRPTRKHVKTTTTPAEEVVAEEEEEEPIVEEVKPKRGGRKAAVAVTVVKPQSEIVDESAEAVEPVEAEVKPKRGGRKAAVVKATVQEEVVQETVEEQEDVRPKRGKRAAAKTPVQDIEVVEEEVLAKPVEVVEEEEAEEEVKPKKGGRRAAKKGVAIVTPVAVAVEEQEVVQAEHSGKTRGRRGAKSANDETGSSQVSVDDTPVSQQQRVTKSSRSKRGQFTAEEEEEEQDSKLVEAKPTTSSGRGKKAAKPVVQEPQVVETPVQAVEKPKARRGAASKRIDVVEVEAEPVIETPVPTRTVRAGRGKQQVEAAVEEKPKASRSRRNVQKEEVEEEAEEVAVEKPKAATRGGRNKKVEEIAEPEPAATKRTTTKRRNETASTSTADETTTVARSTRTKRAKQ